MLPIGFHAHGGNGPSVNFQVDFGPTGVDHLACTGRRQNKKLKRQRRCAFGFPKLLHESWEVGVRKRRMVFYRPDLYSRR